jgi:hypothetical protein
MATTKTANTTGPAHGRSAMIGTNIAASIGVSLLMFVSGIQGQTPSDQGAIRIMRNGSQQSRQAPDEHFTGSVRVDPLFQAAAPARASGVLVTFEPGALPLGTRTRSVKS